MRTPGMRRRIRSLVAVAMAAMLLSTLAGSAVAATPVVVAEEPPGADGWYSEPVRGSITFEINEPVPPISAGDYREMITEIDCFATGGLASFQRTGDVEMSWQVSFDSNIHTGTVLTCRAVSLRDHAFCLFGTCRFPGLWATTELTTATTTIKVDGSAPTFLAPQPRGLPNANGWYRTSGTVDFRGIDHLSGVDECSTGVPFGGTDSSSGIAEGSCSDNAGNVRHGFFAYKYDATPPVLAPTVQPALVALNGTATATANATDATSGVDTQSCDPVDTSTSGVHEVTCRATDRAGNTTTTTVPYTVGNVFTGFSQPVDNGVPNVAKAGRAIPLKWRITTSEGSPVTDLTTVRVSVKALACDDLGGTEDLIEEYATTGGLQNLGNGYYQFNWSSPKSYASSCKTLHLDAGNGFDHTAEFHFVK